MGIKKIHLKENIKIEDALEHKVSAETAKKILKKKEEILKTLSGEE